MSDGDELLLKQAAIESKRAEQALRTSDELLRKVLDSLPVGVWLIDANGRIREGNPAAVRIWGGAKYVGLDEYKEYKGWWPDSGRPLESHEWSGARAVTKGETVLGDVVEILAFDGVRKTIASSAAPLTDQNGKIEGAIVVVEDITDRTRFEKALEYSTRLLEASRAELRSLSKHFDDRVEEERKSVVKELEDRLGQYLIAVKLSLNRVALERPTDAALNGRLNEAGALIDGALESVKRVAYGLRPFMLDHIGLGAALDAQLRAFEQAAGIRATCVLPASDPPDLDPIAALTLFRIVQEALDNVAKHSAATEVVVKLETAAGRLILEIVDNGKGIPAAKTLAHESLGLAGMRERATRLGGDLSIETAEGRGASIIVRVPIPVVRLH